MKKTTLLALLIGASAFAQVSNYQDSATSGITITQGEEVARTVTRLDNNRQPVTSTFTDAADFQAAYAAECSGSTSTFEDFSGGPAGVVTCGATISDAGDSCFTAGDLEPGFVISAAGGVSDETVFLEAGFIGNTNPLVGANSFADFTIITFTEETFAVGMNIWNNNDTSTEFRVFGDGGALIETFTLTNTVGTEDFFGVIADESITSIEIQEANDGGELFSLLEFGACVLSVNEVLSQQFSIYPNPAQNVITIDNRSASQITEARLFDILGKDTGVRLSDSNLNISSLAPGIYYLSLKTPQGSVTEKVIKQ